MIFSLHGKLIYTNINTVVVECGGVGYKCSATLKTLATMPDIGGNVFVYTHMVVKEDSVDLYAFSSLDELDCFKLITSVNGVGPKIGIALLSDFSSDQVALYIASGDSKSLTKATGVGAKLAQRIVLELKDKVGGFSSASAETIASIGNANSHTNSGEAIAALVSLGYTQSEASIAVGKFDPEEPIDFLIKQALKSMAR